MFQLLVDHYPYYLSTVLLALGIWGMFAKRNLMKKLIALTIFQVSIMLIFISSSFKTSATIPIFDPDLGLTNPDLYINPLPHVLMLTAIVVMVATSGVALAVILMIYRRYHTLDEHELTKRMRE
ncbi:MAG TPA: cation:proton antiporter subunit C [Dehalococcoidales bacterium]|nr:cation:proton antiporter subunit C [Dehalococcoidales bacterium]